MLRAYPITNPAKGGAEDEREERGERLLIGLLEAVGAEGRGIKRAGKCEAELGHIASTPA